MIERYSRPEMKKIWSEEHKFSRWLDVEIAVCEAWAEKGVIPQDAIPKIKQARFDMGRFEEILKVTHHDMTALLGAVAGGVGVILAARLLPKVMGQMMDKMMAEFPRRMMARMQVEGRDPMEMCQRMMAEFHTSAQQE